MQNDLSKQTAQTQAAPDSGGRAHAGSPERRIGAAYSDKAPADDLRSSWIRLLSRYHWDLFGTLTFREAIHPEAAHKRFRLFISILNRKLYGPRWFKHNKGISWCVAMERQQRGVLHFHVLLADPELANLLKGSWFKQEGHWANHLMEVWNGLAGFARIEPIRQTELVQRYVSKYVVKGGEIDLGGPLMQRRLEQATSRPVAKSTTRGDAAYTNGSASVPDLPGRGGERGPLSFAPSPVASLSPSLEAGRASASDLVELAHVHGVTGGASNLPERGPVSQ